MKKIANILFFLYKTVIKLVLYIFSLKTGPTCRFHPGCSEYAMEVFKKYGFFKGFWKTIQRISRCHPWSKGGIDLP